MHQQATANAPQLRTFARSTKEHGRVIELAGPAGSGKTTLRKLLCEEVGFLYGEIPTAGESLLQAPQATLAVLSSCLPRAGRRFNWSEVRSMLYLRAWLRQLQVAPPSAVTVFDQGPVFRLAILREFGPPAVAALACEKWLSAALQTWSQTLSFVVWLDAPNHVLLARIRQRSGQQHVCKTLGDNEAFALLDRYRNAHLTVLADMERVGHTRILRFSSEFHSSDEIADVVRSELRGATDE